MAINFFSLKIISNYLRHRIVRRPPVTLGRSNVPKLKVPKFNLPKFNIPKFNVPKSNVQKFNVSKFNVQKSPKGPAGLGDRPRGPAGLGYVKFGWLGLVSWLVRHPRVR